MSDALREEILLIGNITLINRENLQQVLREAALQQTGLVEEQEVVDGTIVLQAKRVDVESHQTLGAASAKAAEGREAELLEKLPEFARLLVGPR